MFSEIHITDWITFGLTYVTFVAAYPKHRYGFAFICSVSMCSPNTNYFFVCIYNLYKQTVIKNLTCNVLFEGYRLYHRPTVCKQTIMVSCDVIYREIDICQNITFVDFCYKNIA